MSKQLIIEDRTLLVCPHCWTPGEIAKRYPELASFPICRKLCAEHFRMVLAEAEGNRAEKERGAGG